MSFLRGLLRITSVLTVYSSIGVIVGSIPGLAAFLLDKSWHTPFFFGFIVGVAGSYLFYASPVLMERRLRLLKTWKNRNLIGEENYEQLQANLMNWWSERITGRPSISSQAGGVRRGSDAIGLSTETEQPPLMESLESDEQMNLSESEAKGQSDES